MTTLREAAQQALEALESWSGMRSLLWCAEDQKALDTLRAALEQPEQEWLTGCPRCGMDDGCDCEEGTYNPPRREWQSLTDEEIAAALPHEPGDLDFVCARAIEAALKEKNT